MDKKDLTVLIIDDAAAEHELYREYLSDDDTHRYHFIDAYTGAEGEALYHANDVDCVILDYRLPDIDGLEVLKKLSQKHEIVPAVMLTGEGSETIAVIAMKVGSQDYMPKNAVTPQALRRTVERAADRSRLMRRMETYRAELERSNQDLERFVSVVAHDLKSPLRAITQHLQLVRDQIAGRLDDKSKKSMGFAIDGADRMRRLIDALFEFSKAGFDKHPFDATDCNRILDHVRLNLSVTIEEKGAVVTGGDLPTVMADGQQIMQLLQNLVGNALKFCKEKPEIHVSAKRDGARWVFCVRDNGIGIPPEGQGKIFTIFKRLHTESEYEGCGVGLAICERVVKNHHGDIWVESEAGKGASFYFALPDQPAKSQEKAA